MRVHEQARQARAGAVTQRDGSEISRRLDAFPVVIDQERIGPLTWPGETGEPYTARVLRVEGRIRFYEEMFADAFSMWKTNRRALEEQAPALVRFFEGERHLE